MSSRAAAARCCAWACALVGALVGAWACAPRETLTLDPAPLVFTPASETHTLRLHNPGEAPLPLTDLRFDTTSPDWGAFVLRTRRPPAMIPAGGAVELEIATDRRHFTAAAAVPGQPPSYRPGHARLLFTADSPQTADLRFTPAPTGERVALPFKLAAAAALTLGLGLLARRRRGTPPRAIPWLLLVTAALLPWGPPLCWGALLTAPGAATLAQCGAGYGGTALVLAAIPGGLLLPLAILLMGALWGFPAGLRGEAPALALARSGRRLACDLSLLLALLPAILGAGTLDPSELIDHQRIAGWGIAREPVAAALALAALALRPRDRRGEGLALAALVSLVLLGGWALPGGLWDASLTPRLAHGVALACGVAVSIAKIAAILGAVALLRRGPLRPRDRGGTRRFTALLGLAAAAAVVSGVRALLAAAAP